ncbi:hypothetical protein [Desulfovirgula thermocuniculi]|uniref:hypothetical protein n=1 Tax=Desulfovirgula thermocuniculi TaxID=348842 RepID=UPI000428A5CB|nr:hypothetical protein [Desulfovirgula thermocuniculi]
MSCPAEDLKKREVVDSLAETIKHRFVAPTRSWLARVEEKGREVEGRLARAEQELARTRKQVKALFGALALVLGCLGYLFLKALA